MTDTRDGNSVQVIARAAAILRTLQNEPGGLSLAEIARRVDLPRSTVQRIIGALVSEMLVMMASPTRGYCLGPAIVSLWAASGEGLQSLILPLLHNLSLQVGETIDLCTIRGDRLISVSHVLGCETIVATAGSGKPLPLPATAGGKAFLATLPGETARVLVGESYQAYTESSRTSWDQLKAELEVIRSTGFAVCREEHSRGLCAVAVALEKPFKNPLAISILVPSSRFGGREQELADALMTLKRDLVTRLTPTL